MAQKSNPISLRLEKTNKHWNSCWYGDYNYTTQLLQDCAVDTYIQNICQQAKIAPPVVFINRGRQQMRTLFFFPRQRFMRKTRVKRGKFFSVPEQKRNSLVENLSSLKKIEYPSSRLSPQGNIYPSTRPALLPDEKTLQLGAKKGANCCIRRRIFQYLLFSLLTPGWNLNSRKFLGTLSILHPLWNSFSLEQRLSGSNHGPLANYFALARQEFSPMGSAGQGKEQGGKGVTPRRATSPPGLASPPAKFFSKGNTFARPVKNHLQESMYGQTGYKCKIHFLLCPSAHQNPLFLATQVVFSLEERVPFRRLKGRLIREISKDSGIKGVRITCSGRVAARSKKAQKAKTESIQWGQTSLHVFSDFVHFASKSARTGFGKIGVKVWICYR